MPFIYLFIHYFIQTVLRYRTVIVGTYLDGRVSILFIQDRRSSTARRVPGRLDGDWRERRYAFSIGPFLCPSSNLVSLRFQLQTVGFSFQARPF